MIKDEFKFIGKNKLILLSVLVITLIPFLGLIHVSKIRLRFWHSPNCLHNLFCRFQTSVIDQWPGAGSGEPMYAFSRDAPEEETRLRVFVGVKQLLGLAINGDGAGLESLVSVQLQLICVRIAVMQELLN